MNFKAFGDCRTGKLILILLGAASYALAYPPFELTLLAWLAPVCWLLLLSDPEAQWRSGRGRFRPMLITGYFGSAAVVFWLKNLFSVGAVVLWIIPALWFGLWGLLAGAFGKSHWILRVLWPAIAWVGVEYLRCELAPLAFSFGNLGSSQANRVGFTLASFVGVYGVSGIMVLSGSTLIELWRTRARFIPVAVAAIVLAGVIGLSWFAGTREKPAGSIIGRAALQQLAQNDDIASWQSVPQRTGRSKPDLIVWPELTYANDPALPECKWFVDLMKMDAAHSTWGSIFGAVKLPPGSKSVYDPFYNTAYHMTTYGSIAGVAVKNQPVQLIADGMPADDVVVMDLGKKVTAEPVMAGVGICYDGCFQKYARRMVSRGAQFLVFPTMNAEAWGTIQHRQHQRLFQMRAAETGRTVLIAAVSGPTFAAAPGGKSGPRAPFHTTATVMADIQQPVDTWFTKVGYITGPLCLLLTCVGAIFGVIFWLLHRRPKARASQV